MSWTRFEIEYGVVVLYEMYYGNTCRNRVDAPRAQAPGIVVLYKTCIEDPQTRRSVSAPGVERGKPGKSARTELWRVDARFASRGWEVGKEMTMQFIMFADNFLHNFSENVFRESKWIL